MATRRALVGNVVNDPELRFTPNGKAVVHFRLAVDRGHQEGDHWVKDPSMFWTVTAWEQLALNVIDSVKRGVRLNVYGRVDEPRTYADKTTGEASRRGRSSPLTTWR